MSQRLFVGNLSPTSDAAWLRAAFSGVGDVVDVQVIVDKYTGRPRGFAFVTMASDAQAALAVARMNGTLLDGRPLRVNEAEPRRARRA